MGDFSLGRSIRKRRDSLGLSQARLAELVGRSATTIRNWERDKTSPSDRSDVVALAAVLGLDESEALAQAGFESEETATHVTMEQSYSSLGPVSTVKEPTVKEPPVKEPPTEEPSVQKAPAPDAPAEPVDARPVDSSPSTQNETPAAVPATSPDSDGSSPVAGTFADFFRSEADGALDAKDTDQPVGGVADDPVDAVVDGSAGAESRAARRRRLGRAAPPTVLETAPAGEPSYMEDSEERQRYRVRAMVTAMAIVGLVIVLFWSFDRATDALAGMWNEFISVLDF